MAGVKRFFENTKNKKGEDVPVDIAQIKKAHDWAKSFVRTEAGVFAFSDHETAQNFAGEVGTVTLE